MDDLDALTNIVANVREKRWSNDPFSAFAELRRTDPATAMQLVTIAFGELPEGGTIVDTALSYVTESEFDLLIQQAISHLAAESAREVSESVIAYGSLQFPQLLHPHLNDIFRLSPNEGAYYENWPWREAPSENVEWLASIVSTDASHAFKAWQCLLEMRSRESLNAASALSHAAGLQHPLKAYLEEVGYNSPDTPLFTGPASHINFPRGYFESAPPAWSDRGHHPTWHASSAGFVTQFGGAADTTCGVCHQRAHHLVTLPGSMSPLHKELRIVTCLSCLGWEEHVLFYGHHGSQPASLDKRDEACIPQFPAVSLKATTVSIAVTPRRWQWQDWALSNSRENLNRVNGHPSWVQSAEYPACRECNSTMRFLMQLDSDLPTADGDEWLWGGGGICYVFLCAPCEVTALLWQCT